MPPSRLQYTLRRKSQRFNAVELAKIYSVCTSNLASHRVIAERNRVFSTVIIVGVIVVVIVIMSSCTRQQLQAHRDADVSVKSRISKIHLCLALHEFSGIVISK